MNPISTGEIESFIAANVVDARAVFSDVLDEVTLPDLLQDENPYQLMRKGFSCVDDLVRSLLDKRLDRDEAHLFENLLQQLAVYVCQTTCGGRKSGLRGIDLEFARGGDWYIVSFTPFPDYDEGNEALELEDNFRDAAASIERTNPTANVVAVNGCLYGWEPAADNGEYLKCCGPAFWELISGDAGLYKRIVVPLRRATVWNSVRLSDGYGWAVNRLSAEFCRRMCDRSGAIDWEAVTEYASGQGAELAPRR